MNKQRTQSFFDLTIFLLKFFQFDFHKFESFFHLFNLFFYFLFQLGFFRDFLLLFTFRFTDLDQIPYCFIKLLFLHCVIRGFYFEESLWHPLLLSIMSYFRIWFQKRITNLCIINCSRRLVIIMIICRCIYNCDNFSRRFWEDGRHDRWWKLCFFEFILCNGCSLLLYSQILFDSSCHNSFKESLLQHIILKNNSTIIIINLIKIEIIE